MATRPAPPTPQDLLVMLRGRQVIIIMCRFGPGEEAEYIEQLRGSLLEVPLIERLHGGWVRVHVHDALGSLRVVREKD
jgi:hypothetical protein